MGHSVLGLIVSSVVMAVIFISILITERRCGRRSADFFKRTGPQIDELAQRAQAKYRARYGKDPTLKIQALPDAPQKR